MTGGLIIRLRPHEKFLVNGAVLQNGEKRTKLRVKSQDAKILRLRDALHPEEATTPIKRLYYTAQLVVAGEVEPAVAAKELLPSLDVLKGVLPPSECGDYIEQSMAFIRDGEFYQAMRSLKQLIPYEEKLLVIAKASELNLGRMTAQ